MYKRSFEETDMKFSKIFEVVWNRAPSEMNKHMKHLTGFVNSFFKSLIQTKAVKPA